MLVTTCGLTSLPVSSPADELRQGVIIDSGRGAAYIATPEATVEAVDLASGRTAWTSTAGVIPLALHRNVIAVQAAQREPGKLPIVLLDVDAQGRSISTSSIALPAGVRPLLRDERGRSFRVSARSDGDAFAVSWVYRETTIEGAVRDRRMAPEERTLSGTQRIPIPAGTRAVAMGADPVCPAAAADDLKTRYALEEAPSRAGRVFALPVGGRGDAVVLRRWDACTGAPFPDVELSASAVAALRSVDDKHLLVIERVGAGGPDDPEFRWIVVSMENGRRVGELRRDAGAARFLVWRDTIVFDSQPHGFRRGGAWIDVPLELIGVRLSTGEPVWRRPIHDPVYRGPTPPAQ